jgi:hypothetical protein
MTLPDGPARPEAAGAARLHTAKALIRDLQDGAAIASLSRGAA